MNEIAQNLFDHIQGLWPDWTPSNAETEVCINKLGRINIDFLTGKEAITNFFFVQERISKKPPLPKIIQCLGLRSRSHAKKEPTLLYTIIKEKRFNEGIICGLRFSVSNKYAPTQPEIEECARRDCDRLNRDYRENHIIIYAPEKKEKAELYRPATREEKIRILKEEAARGNKFVQEMLKKKQLNPVAALSEELSYEERNT